VTQLSSIFQHGENKELFDVESCSWKSDSLSADPVKIERIFAVKPIPGARHIFFVQ